MATQSFYEESLVERDEVNYPATELIDAEPLYTNFTAIQSATQYQEAHRRFEQSNYHRSHSNDDQYRAVRVNLQPVITSSSIRHHHSNEASNVAIDHLPKPFRVPIGIESKAIDGHIFNLTRIVEAIGYDRNTPFIRLSPLSPSFSSNTKNVSALLNIVLKMGGAEGPLVNVWRSNIRNDYFEKWYMEKFHHQSTVNTVNHQSEWITDRIRGTGDQPLPRATVTKEFYNNQKFSSPFENSPVTLPRSSSTSSIMTKSDHSSTATSKQHVTFREDQWNEDYQRILSDYHRFLSEHPEVNQDPNPEIITRPNPNQTAYEQNVSIRYLVPPTPPPPGPLIIREIIPPRAPTPPPLIIKQQEPSLPTPPPLILREAPPPLPPREGTTVITKVLPPPPPPERKVIFERQPSLPPKPQPVIIERWLPYKSPPDREVIYERIDEQGKAVRSNEQATTHQVQRQRRHSAEFQTSSNSNRSSSVSRATNTLQRRNSTEEHHQTAYDQWAWNAHEQYQKHLFALQQQGQAHAEAHRQWMAQQWQQHHNYLRQFQTAPSFVFPQPLTMNTGAMFERREVRQQRVIYNPTFLHHLC